MFNLKSEIYLKIISLFSFIALIGAYFIEYVLDHQPCNLCLIERIPYGLSIFLILVHLIYKKNEKFLIILLILIFLFSFLISIYHFGIEQGFFKDSAVCGSNNVFGATSKEEILKQLNEKIISCKDVTLRIFGLSLTSINIVISLIFIITLTKIYKKYEKDRQKS